ncbi:conserved Plasmodium protein, unknown function [Plasmodium sp. gorilla clade G2]|uniref:conserved Plasmodium protein, unknown function n=1 Tax=Plasmodium sp. gorilla clade G2 TaxID=880535 RepID=UPI000D21A54B|nr:conserved Plasmodium protein, unknown function [Plasmodium sp. gorilla clade G2]SOV11575.1 conserved Plasmodium protein, unknown function [Plasmodium sp. gorilla clade G2]
MATILTMQFPSSDEEDEDYFVDEENDDDNKDEEDDDNNDNDNNNNNNNNDNIDEHNNNMKSKRKKRKGRSKDIKDTIKKSIIKEKIEKTYKDINLEYEKLYTHESNIRNGDFLLQFHKKDPQIGKNNNSIDKLYNHINKYCSIQHDNKNIKSDNQQMDNNLINKYPDDYSEHYITIKEYKKKSRNDTYVKEMHNNYLVKNALESFYDNNSIHVEKKYMYAGKIYTIKKKIEKTSASYKRYLKTQDKINIGGNFTNIDKLIQNIQEEKQINTIDKSSEDWKQYKLINLVDDDKLKKNQNYLENKFFEENVERRVYENKIKKLHK